MSTSFAEQMLDIWFNSPRTKKLQGDDEGYVESMTDENWEQLGSAMANSTHLAKVLLNDCDLNDQKILSLFRGLTRSSFIETLRLDDNGLSAAGVRSMMPFLQNANNLTQLELVSNSIQSEGFNMLLRALRNSPINLLDCRCCGIESIDIDIEHVPRHLKTLFLLGNSINADGCRGLAKIFLQRRNATLQNLDLQENKIDDEGVEILVEALQRNTSLKDLDLTRNEDISKRGEIMLLKLVSDISSIEATLQSNHALSYLHVKGTFPGGSWVQKESWVAGDEIQRNIDLALLLNRIFSDRGPTAVCKEKIIQTQLKSDRRAVLHRLQEQDVNHSVFNEIDPLHLPEVLSLIGRKHDQGELYVAMLSSIMSLFSTMDRERCIKQEKENYAAKIAQHEARMEELDNELAAIRESVAVGNHGNDVGHRSNKRRRT